jgi:group I intron endonuclease
MGHIYLIENIVNKKVYVGCSKSVKLRIQQHKLNLKNNTHKNKHLQSAYNKYGKDILVFKIIEECNDIDLPKREHFWCLKLQSHKRTFGYNILPTNDESLYCKTLSKESRIKLSIAHTGKVMSPETREKIRLANKKWKPHQKDIDKLKVPIVLLSKKGEFYKEFPSIKEAAEHIKTSLSNVAYVLKIKHGACKGYMAVYKKDYSIYNTYKYVNNSGTPKKPIVAINTNNNERIVFPSMREAIRQISPKSNSVKNIAVVLDNPNRSAYGYKWETYH